MGPYIYTYGLPYIYTYGLPYIYTGGQSGTVGGAVGAGWKLRRGQSMPKNQVFLNLREQAFG